jgi:hypothetical protein
LDKPTPPSRDFPGSSNTRAVTVMILELFFSLLANGGYDCAKFPVDFSLE